MGQQKLERSTWTGKKRTVSGPTTGSLLMTAWLTTLLSAAAAVNTERERERERAHLDTSFTSLSSSSAVQCLCSPARTWSVRYHRCPLSSLPPPSVLLSLLAITTTTTSTTSVPFHLRPAEQREVPLQSEGCTSVEWSCCCCCRSRQVFAVSAGHQWSMGQDTQQTQNQSAPLTITIVTR